MGTDWGVWARRPWRYVIARRVRAIGAAGELLEVDAVSLTSPNEGWVFYRRKGKLVRFWTRAGAQDFANTLNENSPA